MFISVVTLGRSGIVVTSHRVTKDLQVFPPWTELSVHVSAFASALERATWGLLAPLFHGQLHPYLINLPAKQLTH